MSSTSPSAWVRCMNKRLGIIGHFGGGERHLDGQTVKTKTLHDELVKAGVTDMVLVDTWLNNSNRPKLLSDSLKCIVRCKKIILIVSRGGLKVFLPMLYWAKRVFGCEVYLDVIGGNTAELLEKNPVWLRYMAAFNSIWVESKGLGDELRRMGLSNIEVIPNFKNLDIVDPNESEKDSGFRFCTFSRVMKEKGIADAAHAVAHARSELGREDLFLDIWGPVEDGFKQELGALLKEMPFVSYKGCVSYDNSVSVVRRENVLLFPTRWEGEGFPGTVVDAFAAGVPVVASDWNANAEIIEHMKTGLIYPNEGFPNLEAAVEWCAIHPEEVERMGSACAHEAKKYLPGAWINQIVRLIGLGASHE